VFNFSAGPCTLPLSVLEEARAEFVDYQGTGMSLIEMSHRSDAYESVHYRAMELATEMAGAPDDFQVLFVQGGASLQFAMVPLNLLGEGKTGAYALTGAWAARAYDDALRHGDAYVAWEGTGVDVPRTPSSEEIGLRPGTRYLHITANETIDGVQYPTWPEVDVPVVADVSSEFMSRPVPWDRVDLIYGGIQKNLGPAGLAVVFVRRTVLDDTRRDVAAYLRYDVHAAKDSLFNTPPVFAVYMMGRVLEWMKDRGGLPTMEEAARRRAALVYGAIDQSDGFYRCPVEPSSRSVMNVVFRLPSEDLEARFSAEAAERGLVALRGHRSVGGCRASLYSAMPLAGVEALVEFMGEFQKKHA
jgi:phosphoserine aminotransferase